MSGEGAKKSRGRFSFYAVVAALLLYFLSYNLLFPYVGAEAVHIAFMPVALAGWFYGLRGGLITAAFLVAVNVVIMLKTGIGLAHLNIHTLEFVASLSTGALIGYLSDLRKTLGKEAATHKQSEEMLKAIISSSPLSIIMVDMQGSVIKWNPAAKRTFGWSEEEALGKPNPIIPPDKQEEFFSILEKAESGEFMSGLSVKRQKKDGTSIDIRLSTAAVRNEKGGIAGVMGILEDITMWKAMEDALFESERSYRLLFENNPHPMWVYDLETLSFLAVNGAAIIHYGYTKEEFLSMTIKDIRPPEDIPGLLENVASVTEGIDRAGLWRHRKKDSSIIHVEIISHAMTFNGRRAELVLANDVTEKIKAENALIERERQQKAILDNIPDIAWLKDKESRFIATNEPFGEACGVPPAKLVGKTDLDIWPKELAERYRADDREVIRTGKRKQVEEPLVDKDGRQTWIETIKTPIYNDKDEVIGTTGIARDITERKLAEQSLKESEERFRTFFESANDSIFIIDRNGYLLDVNKTAYERLGYTKEEMLSKNISEIDPPEFAAKVPERIEQIKKYGKAVFESAHIRKDGTIMPVEINAISIDYKGKEVMLSIIRDITERKKAEEELSLAKHDWEDTFNTLTDMVTVHDKDYNIVKANKSAEKILGLSFISGKSCEKCFAYYHGTGNPPEGCPSCKSLLSGKPTTFELFEPHLNMYIEIRAIPRFDSEGNIAGLIHIVRDISERRKANEKILQLNRIYSVLSGINESIIRASSKQSLFDDICGISVKRGLFRMVWIGVIDSATQKVKPVSSAGNVNGYLDSLNISLDPSAPEAQGPTGTALREKRYFICNDIEKSGYMLPWHEEALKRGYRSSAAFPFKINGEIAGTINFYSENIDVFNEEEIKLLAEVANDVSFAVETIEKEEKRIKAEEELRESEEKFRALADESPNMIFINKTGRIVYVNKKCETIMGYKKDEFYSPDFSFLKLISPEYVDIVKRNFARHLKGEEVPPFEYELVAKDGFKLTGLHSTKIVSYEGGPAILGIVTDITERKNMEKELKNKISELEKFYNMAVGRELKMKELKKEIERLNAEISKHSGI